MLKIQYITKRSRPSTKLPRFENYQNYLNPVVVWSHIQGFPVHYHQILLWGIRVVSYITQIALFKQEGNAPSTVCVHTSGWCCLTSRFDVEAVQLSFVHQLPLVLGVGFPRLVAGQGVIGLPNQGLKHFKIPRSVEAAEAKCIFYR